VLRLLGLGRGVLLEHNADQFGDEFFDILTA